MSNEEERFFFMRPGVIEGTALLFMLSEIETVLRVRHLPVGLTSFRLWF